MYVYYYLLSNLPLSYTAGKESVILSAFIMGHYTSSSWKTSFVLVIGSNLVMDLILSTIGM